MIVSQIAEIETEDGRWEILMLSKNHIPEQDSFPLYNDKPLIFGRSKKLCHIVLSSPKTSRQHCKIWVRERDDTPCIMLLSNNYIEINDERYRQIFEKSRPIFNFCKFGNIPPRTVL